MDKWRTYNGRDYKYAGSEKTKADALNRAKKYREKGVSCRVTKYGSGYGKMGIGYDIWIPK
jgi:hypothetical protein